MLHTLLIITLFLLASLPVCLLTLRLSINVKHLCHFFHSLLILTDILKFWLSCLLNLTKISNLTTTFIRHLKVSICWFILFMSFIFLDWCFEGVCWTTCSRFESFSGYFVLIETSNLLMQWWKDQFQDNKLFLFDFVFFNYFVNNNKSFFHTFCFG